MPSLDTKIPRNVDGSHFDILVKKGSNDVGFGLNLTCKSGLVRVVSFRRLPNGEMYPAETCGVIQIGDALVGIDGEVVHSLSSASAKLKACNTFALLRFVRDVMESSKDDGEIQQACPVQVKQPIPNPEQLQKTMAIMIKELLADNELLCSQLNESRLLVTSKDEEIAKLHQEVAQLKIEIQPNLGFKLFHKQRETAKKFQLELETSLGECRGHTLREVREDFEKERQKLKNALNEQINNWKDIMINKNNILEGKLLAALNDLEKKNEQVEPNNERTRLYRNLKLDLESHRNEECQQLTKEDCVLCELLKEVRQTAFEVNQFHQPDSIRQVASVIEQYYANRKILRKEIQ